ncbi:Hsp20/alpha crystallin family protein [uncultured Desulfobacterium sp.]|uniref:Hsp20/alpha crystallin family protein n=1 Tax=uncultured Desulfobacterium sp. TaxID=201089 RepID=A0A445MV84_9BACT|nr:Hsp20/alpha crystallin family protein [uncultured Desulfobacterium sp.]
MLLRRFSDWPGYGLSSPFDEIDRIRREMDRLSAGLGRGVFSQPRAGVFPLMNITDRGDAYVVRAELPGMKADEIEISITRDTLALSGERKIAAESKNAKYHRKEREAGKFSRIVTLPGEISTETVEATCADGILTVVLTKSEKAKPKQISIKSE